MRFNKGYQVVDQDFREQGPVARITGFGHAVAHNDDHLFHLPVRQQPVRDAAHMALIDPAGFIFAIAMLQIQHRVFLLRIIFRRSVYQADLMLAGHGGGYIMPGYSPVFHAPTMREDVAENKRERADMLRNAPDGNDEYFIVPRIV